MKRRAAQVRKGVDALLAKYRSGGRVVHRHYDYDYALDAETTEAIASVSDAIKSALFSSRCIDKAIHSKDGKVTYMTVGNDYEKFSRNADKACELMLRAGRARHLVVLGDYFKHAKTVSDVIMLLKKPVSRIEVSLADACRNVVVYCWEQHSRLSCFGVVLTYQSQV